MKLFRTNMMLFVALPAFVTILMLGYMVVIYSRSAVWVNAVNICFDGIILVYYFTNFAYQVRMDDEWLLFYSAFGMHKVSRKELGFVISSPIMTKFVCKHRSFYILTSKGGGLKLKSMFKDLIKDSADD